MGGTLNKITSYKLVLKVLSPLLLHTLLYWETWLGREGGRRGIEDLSSLKRILDFPNLLPFLSFLVIECTMSEGNSQPKLGTPNQPTPKKVRSKQAWFDE